jgi:ribosome-interacting GTPase 1
LLKARLAKLRSEIIEGEKKASAGAKGEGFDVEKHGDARIAMIGFPSVGKSSILNRLTETESLAAAYEFTTLTCIPGVLRINDANI